jgi:hypothetical protein
MSSISFGGDFNQPGASKFARGAIQIPKTTFEAIVEDVVTNELGGTTLQYESDGRNVGEIRYRSLPEDSNVETKNLPKAYPMNIRMLAFPLVGEQVLIHHTVGGVYYSTPVNISNKISDNTSTVFTELNRPVSTDELVEQSQLGRNQIQTPPSTQSERDAFIKNLPSRHLRAAKGDTILQGRFGNTIRLGSNLFKTPATTNVSPNIILTAGQWELPVEVSTALLTNFSSYFESINFDRSSIWMVADQVVPLLPKTALSASPNKSHLRSSEKATGVYSGAQIFINSDRVILNSKENEISLFSNTEINLSAIKSITIDTESSIFLSANRNISIQSSKDIILRGNRVSIQSEEDLSYKTSGNYTIIGQRIFIGRYNDISQPLVMGAKLATWLRDVLSQILSIGALQTSVGPAVFNPTTRLKLEGLLQELGGITPRDAVFNSKDNFTTENNSV